MESFDIHLDQENELAFNVTVEGTEEADLRYQLVLESEKMSYSFPGTPDTSGEVFFTIPPLQKILSEGTYNTRLEVVVDDRIFVPLAMHTNAKKQIKVVAEARVISKKPVTKVSASVISKASSPQPKIKTVTPTEKSSDKVLESKNIQLENLTEEQVRKLAKIIARKRNNKKSKA